MATNKQKRKLSSGDCLTSNKARRFVWSQDMIKSLIDSLTDYKVKMEYEGKDFNADKPQQYESLRKSMTDLFPENEYQAFGPPDLPHPNVSDNIDDNVTFEIKPTELKNKIKVGYNRIMEKVKEIRQSFNSAVEKGTRSGSGRIVIEYYDALAKIYKGSPSAESLTCGIDTDATEEDRDSNLFTEPIFQLFGHTGQNRSDDDAGTIHSEDVSLSSTSSGTSFAKSKVPENIVPKLIDDKRRHMERRLSAAQRDSLLLQQSKEDMSGRRDLINVIRESSAASVNAFEKLTEGFLTIGRGLTEAVGILAQSMVLDNNQPPNNNSWNHGAHNFTTDNRNNPPHHNSSSRNSQSNYRGQQNMFEEKTYHDLDSGGRYSYDQSTCNTNSYSGAD